MEKNSMEQPPSKGEHVVRKVDPESKVAVPMER